MGVRSLFASVLLVAACVGPVDEPVGESSSAQTSRPALAHLPDLGDLYAGACGTAIGSCAIHSRSGRDPRVEAKRIYDTYFGARRPADFGWTDAPDLAAYVEARRLPTLPQGRRVDRYKEWLSFAPVLPSFSRTESRPNDVVFRELRAEGAAPERFYEQLNPH
ncbi:MAG: hypothetical protein KF819_04440 [Labilithrix sp.]|nr:hypothetical protein [Labilithrix sp.]